MLNWTQLLSAERMTGLQDGRRVTEGHSGRTDFERDYHRILFSYPFRRLQGKTQVFPMPGNDHIHNRLIHSLEVASVGSSLGKEAGAELLKRHPELEKDRGLHPSDFGDIVSAACLGHDLGNPPFGHAGEEAIARWFTQQKEKNNPFFDDLTQQQSLDLLHFEGNAQGFRIVSSLSMYQQAGGMRLTAATLGAFSKYPQESFRVAPKQAGVKPHVAQKKFGYFHSEQGLFEQLADHLGLGQPGAYQRHPLAWLMEAADDICYAIMDVEDGFLINRFSFTDVLDMFQPITGTTLTKAAHKGSERETVNHLRSQAITRLVSQVVKVFCDNEQGMLDGSFATSLIDVIPDKAHMEHISHQSTERCYKALEVVEILLAGYKVIGSLLDIFIPVALRQGSDRYDQDILRLLPPEVSAATSTYERILTVVDYIAGMTDEYATTMYKRLTGIEMPSARVIGSPR